MAGTANLRKVCLIAAWSVASSWSVAEVLVINPSSKSSPAAVFATALKNAIPGASFYQASSCTDAKRMYEKTPDAVMVYNSSVDFSNRLLDIDCKLPSDAKVALLTKQYMRVCTAADSGFTFSKGRVLLGMASMYSTKAHEADFNNNGFDVRLVPYAGSKDILAAVLNKDIQFGYLAGAMSKSEGLVCPYSTNPADKHFIGNAMKLKVPAFRINLAVYAKTDMPEVTKVKDDKAFSDFAGRSEFELEWLPAQQSIKSVAEFVDTLYTAYK